MGRRPREPIEASPRNEAKAEPRSRAKNGTPINLNKKQAADKDPMDGKPDRGKTLAAKDDKNKKADEGKEAKNQ